MKNAMVHRTLYGVGSLSALATCLWSQPTAPVKPVTDNYFGTKVSDPYRYMENLKDPEVQSWFKGQNDYARSVLGRIPGRTALSARIRELDQSVPLVDAHRLPGDVYLIWKILPNEDADKLYLRRGREGEDKLLVDPEKISLTAPNQNKGKNRIAGCAASDDALYVVCGITPGGSEMNSELHVVETATGLETGDVISRGVGVEDWHPYWLPDNRSFVYGRLQELPAGAPVTEIRKKYRSYLHVLGSDPGKDRAIFGYGVVPSIDVDPSLIAFVSIQPGSRYAVGRFGAGNIAPNRALYIEPVEAIAKSKPEWRKIADLSDDVKRYAIHGDDLFLLTFKNSPRYQVIRTNVLKPDLASAETIVPASEAVITQISAAQDALYVSLLDGGIGRLLRVPYGPNPKPEPVVLPFEGTADFDSDPRVPGGLLYLTAWNRSVGIYSCDPVAKQVTRTSIQPAGLHDNPTGIEAVEVKVRSHDGTMVPLSIVHRKGMKLDGSNPTRLQGYGAYGSSQSAYYFPAMSAWYEKGGVFAVCHVRGGGEYGEAWHLAGKGFTKPNTWLDFIACADYLVANKYTSAAHLAGEGVSAGGILIGRAITERPDLFRAAVIGVGLSDMLRVETTSNGQPNIREFGSVKTEKGFQALYAMSAYHHVRDGTRYPAVLLTTGFNDPNVEPWEPGKMTARLQAATASGNPVLLRVDYGGGHGASGLRDYQEQLADEWAFLLWQLGVPEFQPHP